MKYEDARKEYLKKHYGKCYDCMYRNRGNTYCNIREEFMLNELCLDWLVIKLCRYYEKLTQGE